jgi:hypothetical protein
MSGVFFYGLFMDVDVLRGQQIDPMVDGAAVLPDYQLRIGNKATLVAAPGSVAYGIVMTLAEEDLQLLYAQPGVSDYRPEPVTVVMSADRSTRSALCYNISADDLGRDVNSEYAQQLAALAAKLGFPEDYVGEILRCCG